VIADSDDLEGHPGRSGGEVVLLDGVLGVLAPVMLPLDLAFDDECHGLVTLSGGRREFPLSAGPFLLPPTLTIERLPKNSGDVNKKCGKRSFFLHGAAFMV